MKSVLAVNPILLALVLFTVIPALGTGRNCLAAQEAGGGQLVMHTVQSGALARNTLGDPGHRNVMVYLPPSYDGSQQRYPVVYFLHGYDDTNTVWRDGRFSGFSLPGSVDELIRQGTIREMILVFPDARNFYFGSFYTNSTVTGQWEDFLTDDLPNYIDGHYRTLASPSSRGIAGHSMGGYGALYIAARNPDVFSAVWGISSATLAMVGDVALEEEWKKTLALTDVDQLAQAGNYVRAYVAIAAALSPHPGKGPFQADFPFRLEGDELVRNPEVWSQWTSQFPADSMEDFEGGFRKLTAIAFDVGSHDQFSHIPAGSRLLSERLTERGISHRFEVYDAGHWDGVGQRLNEEILPFFSNALKVEP